jgi:hypothetical protein
MFRERGADAPELAPSTLGGSDAVACCGGVSGGLGLALYHHARALTRGDSLGPRKASTGTEGGRGSTKAWTSYATWDELSTDRAATEAYLAERERVLSDPDLDWGAVRAAMAPKLLEDREYIGLVNLGPDGRTLYVLDSAASPITASEMRSDTSFAGIPAALVEKMASRPALFIFHTHPADPRCCPLPSSHDLSTAIWHGATYRYAADAVISRYGVLVYGLDWSAYKAIDEAKDWKLATLNLSHDVVAAHEAVRSWSKYTLPDYFAFYPRHRLLFLAYPSPELIGDERKFEFLWDLETPIEHDLISDHSGDIEKHLGEAKRNPSRVAMKLSRLSRSSEKAPSPAKSRAKTRAVAMFAREPSHVDLGYDSRLSGNSARPGPTGEK